MTWSPKCIPVLWIPSGGGGYLSICSVTRACPGGSQLQVQACGAPCSMRCCAHRTGASCVEVNTARGLSPTAHKL